ncbi:MAG TPA: hypothetical protein VFD41_10310 [Actinomycetales bacterium]|nr:hypothetical protein [Actinomycetales bacterium]
MVEALSGGAGDDVLRGMEIIPADILDADRPLNRLTEEHLLRTGGLTGLLRPAGGADYALRFMANPLAPVPVGVSNLLLGGSGSDLIEGNGTADFIDGDAYLRVQLEYSVTGERFDSGRDLEARVFSGEINPGDINIVREVVTDPDQAGAIDTAVFALPRGDVEIVDLGNGYVEVWPGDDPEDRPTVLHNIEVIQFNDCTVTGTEGGVPDVRQRRARRADRSPTEGQELTAEAVFDEDLVTTPTDVSFSWEISPDDDDWAPSVTADEEAGLVSTFTPGVDDVGFLRVVVTFLDDDGQPRSIVSESVGPVEAAP